MRDIITIRGSWGDLRVDVATGIVIEASHCPLSEADIAEGNQGYRDIARFEPASLAREFECSRPYAETDILATGFWDLNGVFTEPLTVRQVTDQHGSLDFDDWVPFALLPAPEARA